MATSISTVTSNGNTSARKSVTIEIDVKPVYAVGSSEGKAGDINGTLFFREIQIMNQGNIADNYTMSITNSQELLINGWEVAIEGSNNSLSANTKMISPGSNETANITFRAIRAVPNGNITVAVMLTSNASSFSTIAMVKPVLPDLLFSPGPGVIGDNIYMNDIFAEREVQNAILLIALAAVTASIFIIRKLKFGRFLR